MTYETISIEQRGPVDWLTLNRPDTLNSINNQMVADLSDYFGRLFNARPSLLPRDAGGEAWLAGHPDAPAPLVKGIRRAVRDAFFVDADDWKGMIHGQFRAFALQTINGLAAA